MCESPRPRNLDRCQRLEGYEVLLFSAPGDGDPMIAGDSNSSHYAPPELPIATMPVWFLFLRTHRFSHMFGNGLR